MLQDFFFPSAYRDQQKTARLRPGDTRLHTELKLDISFSGDTNFKVPTREPSKVNIRVDVLPKYLLTNLLVRIGFMHEMVCLVARIVVIQ
jgi:hypothetical protein